MIGFRTALVLYAALAVLALFLLKGTALAFALLVVFALAAKTYVHYLRTRLE